MMAKGGEMKHDKLDEMVEKYQMWLDKNNLPQMSADELLVDESVNLTKEQRKYIQNFSNEWNEEQDKYAKGGSLSSIKEEYYENEDNNAHSENVVLLAKNFGTKEDLTEAKRILALHEKEGSLSSENGKKRQVLHLKLIEKARTEMAKDGIEFEKGGYMEKGGISQKEVAESNAEMVLSQIKAVKHHAEELSSVVSSKSNIEAWVVGKIERASTDLSDITHYLEGNKDKMSMGGSVRYYTHKMDK
jgi:hypothetical protein